MQHIHMICCIRLIQAGIFMNGKLVLVAKRQFDIYRRPSHLSVILRDKRHPAAVPAENSAPFKAAMEWLCRAQDVTGCGGVSGGYHFDTGWRGPYPETTGYIIETFIEYSSIMQDTSYLDRAVRMGDWECEIQLDSGAVRGGVGVNDYPIVFNTGQVMLGWAALYRETGERRYLDSAIRAADWLVSIQDEDGKWSRYTYKSIPHAYHTRVAWQMFEISKLSGDDRYRSTAERNIQWTLSGAKANGWIENMAFMTEETPLTHTIAYTIRGLLESSQYQSEPDRYRTMEVVLMAAENLMKRFELRKPDPYSMPDYLPARLNNKWKPGAEYSCLTGNCQIAIIWLKLFELTEDARFLNAALKIIDHVKATQSLDSSNPGIRGGIAGSFPIQGGYSPYSYPNWPPKFFADALILQEKMMEKLEAASV